ncbi:natterin-3-like [Pungitius pungitius]|uniref:natterin-3-like n=1 Tax=Pungitius pungitius TaxID=134920 RepID=UPI002E0F65D0
MLLDPSLMDRIPNITEDASTDQALPTTLNIEIKSRRDSSANFDQTALKWQPFEGYVPDGAVSIYNGYVGRTDYVCQYGCIPGFYSPGMDSTPSCHYSYNAKEYLGYSFFILVNENNFEILEWEEGSYGSVPQNSVSPCNSDVYVGKNKYGLGKLDVKNKAFFLPWKGSEYWYKDYQVLTFSRKINSEHISDVQYETDGIKPIEYPPQALEKSELTNKACQTVILTATLSKMIQVEERWDTSFSVTSSAKVTITAGIPVFGSGNIEVGVETTFQLAHGTTYTESTTHSVTVQHNVPPNHSCSISLVGNKFKADIPFTARLSRTYNNGETKWMSISGIYKGVQMAEVRATVDSCVPVPHPTLCP